MANWGGSDEEIDLDNHDDDDDDLGMNEEEEEEVEDEKMEKFICTFHNGDMCLVPIGL